MTAVRAIGVGKRFGDATILDGVDLDLAAGEVTMLMGPNGEGKTVLLCCLAGALRPSAGRAFVEGRPAHAAGDRLSLLLQDAVGLPALTGPENARFYAALHPSATGRWSAMLERFELSAPSTPLKHCSGGTRRKVELAVALDPDVPVYLLDEPTAALDLGAVHELHRLLRGRRGEGAAVVLTSHAPLDVRLADRLVFVHEGAVVADGDPGALLGGLPRLARLRGAIHEAAPKAVAAFRAGHAFGSGPELRGFLRPGWATDDLAARLRDVDVTVDRDDPTAVDLYEYLTSVGQR